MRIDHRKPVRFAAIERITEVRDDPDRFEFRPERGWRWLQRTCLTILRWIGAHHQPTITTFVRTPQQNDDLLKSLLGQEGECIDLVYDAWREGDRLRIYMGPDDHDDLIALAKGLKMQPFNLAAGIEIRHRDHGGKWHDIPITIVPWMHGAVIVPVR